jgi:hypothetical protein
VTDITHISDVLPTGLVDSLPGPILLTGSFDNKLKGNRQVEGKSGKERGGAFEQGSAESVKQDS